MDQDRTADNHLDLLDMAPLTWPLHDRAVAPVSEPGHFNSVKEPHDRLKEDVVAVAATHVAGVGDIGEGAFLSVSTKAIAAPTTRARSGGRGSDEREFRFRGRAPRSPRFAPPPVAVHAGHEIFWVPVPTGSDRLHRAEILSQSQQGL